MRSSRCLSSSPSAAASPAPATVSASTLRPRRSPTSWRKYPMVSLRGRSIAPSSEVSSPVMRRKMVVLPAPLGPTSPTFSPGLSWNDASTNSTCAPYCLVTLENEIMSGDDVHLVARVGDVHRHRSDVGISILALVERAGHVDLHPQEVVARGDAGDVDPLSGQRLVVPVAP